MYVAMGSSGKITIRKVGKTEDLLFILYLRVAADVRKWIVWILFVSEFIFLIIFPVQFHFIFFLALFLFGWEKRERIEMNNNMIRLENVHMNILSNSISSDDGKAQSSVMTI